MLRNTASDFGVAWEVLTEELMVWLQKIALYAQCESHFKSIEKGVCLLCQLESGTQAGQSCLGPDRAILWLSWLSPDTVMVDNAGQPMQKLGHFA